MPEYKDKSFKEIHWEDDKLQEGVHEPGQQQHNLQEQEDHHENGQDKNKKKQNQHGYLKQGK